MNKILMTQVLELCAFLELCSDDVLDPDVAVTMLENVSADLGKLESAEKQELIDFVATLATAARQNGESEERIEFFESFPEAMGLSEEDE